MDALPYPPAGSGTPPTPAATRVVMINARTAVIVPVDQDPGPDDVASGPGGHALPGTAAEETAAVPGDAADMAAPGMTAGTADADAGVDARADAGTDAARDADQRPDDPDFRDWRDELLAQLEALGRIIARATPGAVQAPPAAPPPVAPSPVSSAAPLADLEARIGQVEQTQAADVARIEALIEGLAAPSSSDAALQEAVEDLRIQLRMIEAQVGALGRVLVSAAQADPAQQDGLRLQLAEAVAAQQRSAAVSAG